MTVFIGSDDNYLYWVETETKWVHRLAQYDIEVDADDELIVPAELQAQVDRYNNERYI